MMFEIWYLRFNVRKDRPSFKMQHLFEFANSDHGEYGDVFWIPAVAATRTIARNGAGIRIIRIKDRARHLAVSIVFPWRRGFRFDIDHQREPRNTRNTRNVPKKVRRCCAGIRFSGSGRNSQVNRVFGPRSEPHDLVAPLVDDRQSHCSLFVCFVCFVVPRPLHKSGHVVKCHTTPHF